MTREGNGHIDKVFRDRLRDLQVTPPPDTWEHISSALKKQKTGRFRIWYRVAAVFIIFALMGGGLWLYVKQEEPGSLAGSGEEAEPGIIDGSDVKAEPGITAGSGGKAGPGRKAGSGETAGKEAAVKSGTIAEAGRKEKKYLAKGTRQQQAGPAEAGRHDQSIQADLSSQQQAGPAGSGSQKQESSRMRDNPKTAAMDKSTQLAAMDKSRKTAAMDKSTEPGIEKISPKKPWPVSLHPADPANYQPDLQTKWHSLHRGEASGDYLAARDAEERHSSTQPWIIGGKLSPVFTSGNHQSRVRENSLVTTSASSSLQAYSGGVTIAYQHNEKFLFQSGFIYTNLNHRLNQHHRLSEAYLRILAGEEDHPDMESIREESQLAFLNGIMEEINRDTYSDGNTAWDGTEKHQNPEREIEAILELVNSSASGTAPGKTPNPVYDEITNELVFRDNISESYHYLEIPLSLSYTIEKRNLNILFTGGFNASVLMDKESFLRSESTHIKLDGEAHFNELNFSTGLGMGMGYPLSEYLSLTLQPFIRYYLKPLSKGDMIRYEPWSVYLFSGISYQF